MRSNASKARKNKNEIPGARKKGLTYSKSKTESTENNLNAGNPYRRYNLRSYSPSKFPVRQLTSKRGMYTNADSENLKNQRTNNQKKPENAFLQMSDKEVHSPIDDGMNIHTPAGNSCKILNDVFTKSDKPLPAPEEKNTFEMSNESGCGVTNKLVPFKSILKRTPLSSSPMKNPQSHKLEERDIINERIFGSRERKVRFQTTSCHNLPSVNITSKNLEAETKHCDEVNDSSLENFNNGEERIKETVSKDWKGGQIPGHVILQNKEGNYNDKSRKTNQKTSDFENEKSFCENSKLSQERKCRDFSENINTPDISDEKLSLLLENKISHEKSHETSEVLQRSTRLGDPVHKFDLAIDDILRITKAKSYDNKTNNVMNKNSLNSPLLNFSTPKTSDGYEANCEKTKNKDLLLKKFEEVKISRTHCFQDIEKKRNSMNKRLSINNGKNTNYDTRNIVQSNRLQQNLDNHPNSSMKIAPSPITTKRMIKNEEKNSENLSEIFLIDDRSHLTKEQKLSSFFKDWDNVSGNSSTKSDTNSDQEISLSTKHEHNLSTFSQFYYNITNEKNINDLLNFFMISYFNDENNSIQRNENFPDTNKNNMRSIDSEDSDMKKEVMEKSCRRPNKIVEHGNKMEKYRDKNKTTVKKYPVWKTIMSKLNICIFMVCFFVCMMLYMIILMELGFNKM